MSYRATPLVAGASLLSALLAVIQDASGVVVPVVGATCRGTVGDPGHLVDPDVLRACLLPALEPETRDLAPQAASATTAR